MIYDVDLPVHPSHKPSNPSGRSQYESNSTMLNEQTAFIPQTNNVLSHPPQIQNLHSNWIIPMSMMPRNMVIPTGVNILQTQKELILQKNQKHASFYNSVFMFLAFLITINFAIDLYSIFIADDNSNQAASSKKFSNGNTIQKTSHLLILSMDVLWILLCVLGILVARYQTKQILISYWVVLIITFVEGVISCIVQLYSLKDNDWSEKVFPFVFLLIFILVMIWFIRFSLQLNMMLELRRKLDILNQLG